MTTTTTNEQRGVLGQVLEMMDECATLLRSLHNPRIDAYCLAAFEGRNHGWLGHFERDIIEEALVDLDEDDDE
jgi:hypothetical protein